MIKKSKSRSKLEEEEPVLKKAKVEAKSECKLGKKVKFNKTDNNSPKKTGKFGKPGKQTSFKKTADNSKSENAPPNWAEFKKQKKELSLKRKQSKTSYDVMVKAKRIGEEIRRKSLKGGEEARAKLITKLHNELQGKGHYAKFVLTHDVGRVVQYLLKFGSKTVKEEITKELIPVTVSMLESKYGKFCVKRMLKYSSAEVKSAIIKTLYGHAVKLVSHTISTAVFEYAFSTYATPLEKQHLVQEFFGDMYKQSKDDSVKHLKDIYKNSPEMKAATLGATKANLTRVMNKDLYDSMLVHTVLSQYLAECTPEDRAQIITEIASHSVVLSNSKDGARAVMQCIWHGTNKDRKVVVKSLKEHLIPLSKHEHGHTSIIALIDSMDDTVLLQKSIINELLSKTTELLQNEWGRKVLLWLVAAGDSTHFHPTFMKELDAGRESSSCKKSTEIRRSEVLNGSIIKLLNSISADSNLWLSTPTIGVVTLAILKAGQGKEQKEALEKMCEVITKSDWTITENEKSISGIEHAGFHMILKKLAQHDKILKSKKEATFGEVLLKTLTDDVLNEWIKCNRGCFLLVSVYENCADAAKDELKSKLKSRRKSLKTQTTAGAKILVKKIEE